MTQLWFSLFGGRRVSELPNVLATIPLLGGMFSLASRYSSDRVVAMGWAAALVAIPGYACLLQTTFVDPQAAALLVCAIHFSTRVELRIVDAWLAMLALALAVGAKTLSLVPVGVLVLIVGARLFEQDVRHRRRGARFALVGGFTLVGAMMAACYLRNWFLFHNPFWPDFKIDIDKWNIHWPGYLEWGSDRPDLGGNRLDRNEPLPIFLKQLFSMPPTTPVLDNSGYGYGIGVIKKKK